MIEVERLLAKGMKVYMFSAGIFSLRHSWVHSAAAKVTGRVSIHQQFT